MVKEAREINPFGLRMPRELREQLEAAAQESGRSLNAEIVKRLKDSFNEEAVRAEKQEIVSQVVDRVAALEERMKHYAEVKPARRNAKRR